MKRVCDLIHPYFYYMSFFAAVYHDCSRRTPHVGYISCLNIEP